VRTALVVAALSAAAASPSIGAQASAPPPAAQPGYTLIAPLHSKTIHLLDLDGRVVHQWKTAFEPGAELLLENGNLLRCAREPDARRFNAGGQCGRLEEIAWDGSVVWSWKLANDQQMQHHDFAVTPKGTILLLAWEYKARPEAIAAGRHPEHVRKEGIWSDFVVEIEPIRPDRAKVVWEWHVWDHLVQDLDQHGRNFGKVADHPERIDVNADLRREEASEAQLADMQALGYISNTPSAGEIVADWLHTNSLDYDPRSDQIVLCPHHFCEVWVVDHSTTTAEASGRKGGAAGRGGDLLWRWGNPRNYRAGVLADRQLFYPHDVRWIEDGLPGAGHLTIFNNGYKRPEGDYSTVVEIVPPLRPDRTYGLEPLVPAAPSSPIWSYQAPDPGKFYSSFLSGAERLKNGNTLICEGTSGRVFEVTPAGEVVWDYLNPFGQDLDSTMKTDLPRALFRATRIAPDHPGLKGRELRPIQ